MNKKTIQLTTEQAQELYTQNPDFRSTILSDFTDEELGIHKKLKTWEELSLVEGFYINNSSVVVKEPIKMTLPAHNNLFATEKQAKSALAMAQLSQLMKDLGDECDIDWNDESPIKYTIVASGNVVSGSDNWFYFRFLAFKTRIIRDKFMEKHEQLIKEYFML